jgi:hypothetical protein
MEATSCASSGETGATRLPFASLRVTLAVARVKLRTTGLSPFFVSARFRFRCPFAGHVAAPTDRTAGEGLELARF